MSSSERSVNPICHIGEQNPEEVIDLSLTNRPIECPLVALYELEHSISI
jgi:hypothetical protein